MAYHLIPSLNRVWPSDWPFFLLDFDLDHKLACPRVLPALCGEQFGSGSHVFGPQVSVSCIGCLTQLTTNRAFCCSPTSSSHLLALCPSGDCGSPYRRRTSELGTWMFLKLRTVEWVCHLGPGCSRYPKK